MKASSGALVTIALFLSSCAVDPTLSCGTKCSDGSSEGSTDASNVVEGGSSDSSMCRMNNDACLGSMQCCSGMCDGNERCVPACQLVNQSCSSQPDNCCIGSRCSMGMCVACHPLGDACTTSSDCCSTRCSSGDSGPKVCIPDN